MAFHQSLARLACVLTLVFANAATHAAEGDFIDVFTYDPALSRPDGMVVGPDGALYVSSELGKAILRFDATTGQFLDVFAGSDIPQPLIGSFQPSGLAFGPDGHLYVASFQDHRVHRFDGSSGMHLGVFVTQNNGGLLFPTALAFGPDDNLYVSSSLTDQILKFAGDTGLPLIPFVVNSGGFINSPKGLTFDAVGNLYVSSNNPNQVVRYEDNGATPVVVETYGSAPHSIVVEPNGDLYVSLQNGSLAFYNAALDTSSTIGRGGNRNKGLVRKANGDLLVSSSLTNEILVLDGTTGTSLVQFAARIGLETPYDIGQASNGDFLVSGDNLGIVRIDGDSGELLGLFADNPFSVLGLRNFATGPDGHVYASSNGTNDPVVMRFDGNTGAYLGAVVPRSELPGTAPSDLRFGPDGNLYVGVFSPGQVKRFDATTGLLDDFITVPGGDAARGFAFADNGDVYVATEFQGILRYDGAGIFLGGFAEPSFLRSPTGLAFGRDGNLFVSSSNNSKIVRFNGVDGTVIDDFATGAVNGELSLPSNKLFSNDGNLYVVSAGSNEIQRYEAFEPIIEDIGDVVPDVLAEIQALLDDIATPDKADKDLNKALDKLEKALEKLSVDEVDKAIKEIGKATKELLKAEKDGADVVALIDQLVETSRLEAEMAIEAAINAGGDQAEIDKALEEILKAEEDLADSDPDKAIEHYKKAVEKAEKSLP